MKDERPAARNTIAGWMIVIAVIAVVCGLAAQALRDPRYQAWSRLGRWARLHSAELMIYGMAVVPFLAGAVGLILLVRPARCPECGSRRMTYRGSATFGRYGRLAFYRCGRCRGRWVRNGFGTTERAEDVGLTAWFDAPAGPRLDASELTVDERSVPTAAGRLLKTQRQIRGARAWDRLMSPRRVKAAGDRPADAGPDLTAGDAGPLGGLLRRQRARKERKPPAS